MTGPGAGSTGAGSTGAGSTGAGSTGAGSTGSTGSTGVTPTGPTGFTDPRVKTITIPEKYLTETWAREIKSTDDLWSKMAGVQKLLGKDKIVLPGKNATEEELNAFHTRMGRPENPEGYEFINIEDLKEIERNVELDHGMKKIFFDEGISKEVGERIVTKYENLVYTMQKPMIEQAAQTEVDFQKLADKTLGADKSVTMEAFKSVMRESLGDKVDLVSKIDSMGNEELLSLMVLSKNIHDKYVGESRVGITHRGQGRLTGDLKTDYQTISTQKLAIKSDSKIPEHIRKMKLANLNAQMMEIGVKASEQNIDLFSK